MELFIEEMAPVTRSKTRGEKRKPLHGNESDHDDQTGMKGIQTDINNIALLVMLYLLQGVPLGLCLGSIPFLLKAKLNFAQLAIFSLSSYPYSVKLLWAPIVDTYYFKSLGRRKVLHTFFIVVSLGSFLFKL